MKRRYAAKMLFAFEIEGEAPAPSSICEERIVLLHCRSAREALTKANKTGRERQHQYTNRTNRAVKLKYLGLLELKSIDPELREDEVWYEIRRHLGTIGQIKHRRVPPIARLNAYAVENQRKRGHS